MKVESTDKLSMNVLRCETLLTAFGAIALYAYKYDEGFKNAIDAAMGDGKDIESAEWRTGMVLTASAMSFLDMYLEPNDLAIQIGGDEK